MTTLTHYTKSFVRYLRSTKAVSALEYAILIGIVIVGIGAALTVLNTKITAAITNATGKVTTETAPLTP